MTLLGTIWSRHRGGETPSPENDIDAVAHPGTQKNDTAQVGRIDPFFRSAEETQMNISNLAVRLWRLGLIYLRDGRKTIFRSKDEWSGQGRLLQGDSEIFRRYS